MQCIVCVQYVCMYVIYVACVCVCMHVCNCVTVFVDIFGKLILSLHRLKFNIRVYSGNDSVSPNKISMYCTMQVENYLLYNVVIIVSDGFNLVMVLIWLFGKHFSKYSV